MKKQSFHGEQQNRNAGQIQNKQNIKDDINNADIEKQKKQYLKMTTTPIGKLLVSLSVPTILSMMITNIYNLVDTAFVGTLGTSQSGATGIVFG